MAIVEPLSPSEDGRRRLSLLSTATREPVGELTVSTAEDVARALVRARAAQKDWAQIPVAERAKVVAGAIDLLVKYREDVIEAICRDTGKTHTDALMIEVIASLDFITHYCARAVRDLSDEPVKPHGFLRALKKFIVHYRPLGVVGVITPWNAPFALAVNPTVQALLAGNAVLLKPSEVAPYCGDWAARLFHEAGVPRDLIQVLHGDGETGAALVRAGVDKISFTGSVGTGKKIAAACAEQLIPCTLELGGKDAMIVCADADLERAAGGAVFASLFNSGHVCMGVERIYVIESVADEFERLVEEKLRGLRMGAKGERDVGALFWDRQLSTIEKHIEDARAKGAEIVLGGEAQVNGGIFYPPTLVRNVDHSMDLMTHETFGPIVSIMRVKDEDEAIRLANDSEYGLSGSVWTKDNERGIALAKRMETGSVLINDASMSYGILEVPFGGMKDSGLGQVNGANGLRSYTFAQPIGVDKRTPKTEPHWYPHDAKTTRDLDGMIKLVYGSFLKKLRFFTG
ncbi:MAG: aldehyde dehydrogenase family protein [Polyangiales bacterium]